MKPTDSNRISVSGDRLPLESARSILYLAMGAGCGTRLSSYPHRAQIETTRFSGNNMVFTASLLINVSSCNMVFFGLLMRIYDYRDLSRRRYHVDGWLDPATGCWDKVVDRQTLNRRRPLEPQFPLAKDERRAKLSLASTPASPQKRPLEW